MVNLIQISKHAYPFTGGQEIYIRELNEIIESFTGDVITYANGHAFPKGFTPLGPRLRGIDKIVKDISWVYFNLLLYINRRKYENAEKILVHYAIHNSAILHNNKIVLSHGVDWRDKTTIDKWRKSSSIQLLKDKNVSSIVANDRNFLAEIGFEKWDSIQPFSKIGKVWYIPNVAPKEYRNAYNASVDRENYILVPRNIRPERGISLAIKALSRLEDKSSKMIFAGGPLGTAYYKKCSDLVVKLQLTKRVEFLGTVDHEKMQALYQKCKIVLIPTETQEGTSIAALEAMSCGTPVVSTNVGGLKDLPTVKSTETSPAALAEALETVAKDWFRIRKKQHEAVTSKFSYQSWRQAWLEVIHG